MGWQLHVRNGQHRGARVELGLGRHTVGSGADDDVLLADDDIAPGHVLLEVSELGLRVQAMAGAVGVAGHADALAPGASIDVDGADGTLLLGAVELGLKTVRSPAAEAAAAVPRWRRWGPLRHLPDLPHLPALPAWLQHPSGQAAAGAVATVALVASLVLVVSGVFDERAARAPEPGLAQLQATLAQRPAWGGLRASRAPDGRVLLAGTVADRRELQTLLHRPEFAGGVRGEPQVRVVVEDELRRHVHQATQDPALALALQPASEGRNLPQLVVSGATQRAGVPAILKLLKDEWASRVEIVDRTVYAPDESNRRTLRVQLPIRIAAVNVTEGFVEAADGKRYFVGSAIGPQQTLVSIDEERVVFNVAGKQVPFLLP